MYLEHDNVAGEDDVPALRPLPVPPLLRAVASLGQRHGDARPGVLHMSSCAHLPPPDPGHLQQVDEGELQGHGVDVGDPRGPDSRLPVADAEHVGEGRADDRLPDDHDDDSDDDDDDDDDNTTTADTWRRWWP